MPFVDFLRDPIWQFIGVVISIVAVLGAALAIFENNRKSRDELRDLQKTTPQTTKQDVTDTINESLYQIKEYYVLNKSQARNSFIVSIFAISLGLVTIIFGSWLLYFQNSATLQLTTLSGISGLLLEFIGGAYFVMYRKSIQQMNLFFGQLTKMQDTMLAINLLEKILDQEKKLVLMERIIMTLLQRSSGNFFREISGVEDQHSSSDLKVG